MAVDEQVRIRRSIEEQLGVEEAAYLIEGRPPGGWDTLVTKEYLDLKLEAIDSKFEAIDSKFEAIDSKLESLDSKFDARLESLDSKFDARLESLERRLQRHVNRLVLWLVPTVFAGMAAAGALVGVTS